MKKIILLLTALLFLVPVEAHYKAKYHVIVDTDGGIDDFRAICMLLASPEIEVIAITTSDGILLPQQTADNVTSLLRYFGHEGIPVGIGKINGNKPELPSKINKTALSAAWGKKLPGKITGLPDAAELIISSIEWEDMPVDILCLGPMTNIAEAIAAAPGIDTTIRRIYWYTAGTGSKPLNFSIDPEAANSVLDAGIPLDRIISEGVEMEDPAAFIASVDDIQSAYADAMVHMYDANPELHKHMLGKTLADDLVPLYLTNPTFFMTSGERKAPHLQKVTLLQPDSLLAAIQVVLDANKEDKAIIFKRFPVDPNLFEDDVAPVAEKIIAKHGLKEWKIVVITNEFHEHLGIYSIIGAKMGLRAREYFNVGIDELTISSLAGSNPPVSCLNDGLQGSTGATMGHGTITLAGGDVEPCAMFTFKNTTIRISIKKEIRDQIRKDVQTGVQAFGLNSEEYWIYIRMLAIDYWQKLDRREIFVIEEVGS